MGDGGRDVHAGQESGPNETFKPSTSANINRARQFMPFAALKGYYGLVREAERIKEDKRELSEETLNIIFEKLFQLEKGSMVRVTYYDTDAYVTVEGLVVQLNSNFSKLIVGKKTIPFDDILDVEEEGFGIGGIE